MKTEDEVVSNSKYSFWKLLSEFYIEIPIIQRDYAQGRKSSNETAIRHELLISIYDALVKEEPLDFDFIYGTVEGVNNEKLYPLDGQQRLTTLFLLHWYIAEKENRMDEARDILADFSYTTRVSSREFCSVLINLDYTPTEGVSVTSFVKNENKYFRTWDNDPTIKAMLVMLDAIHEKFFACEPIFDKLIDTVNPLITFNYLPMKNYALTDDLYIKMNARGKALSIFENFKAKFIQHLRNNNLPVSHFEESIDGKWIDLLWAYRSEDNTIDKQFMNLFCFCTEMIFMLFEEPKECESPFKCSDIRKLVDYYDSEEKVEMFYDLMDVWENKADASNYLNDVLTNERDNNKVRLFDGSPDIFSDIVLGNTVSVMNRILLFAIMSRVVRLGRETDRDKMLDYIRITRNLLIKNRSFNGNRCSFVPDFRFGRNGIPYTNFIYDYLSDNDDPYLEMTKEYCEEYEGVNSEIYKQESAKAKLISENPVMKDIIFKLEDLDIFKGSIFNVLDYVIEIPDKNLADDIEAIFTPKNSEYIIRAMLAQCDYGIKLNGKTSLGNRYYYGDKEHWHDIVSNSNGKDFKEAIVTVIKKVREHENHNAVEALNDLIQNAVNTMDKSDWRYCLIKYPSTIGFCSGINNKNIIFAIEITKDITLVHRMNSSTLNGYHVIPEYIEVIHQLGENCTDNIVGQNTDNMGGIELTCKGEFGLSLNNDGGISISYGDGEENIVNEAIEKYNDIDTSGMDNVEKVVAMAQIILEIVDISSK